jgi:hypothetical protein
MRQWGANQKAGVTRRKPGGIKFFRMGENKITTALTYEGIAGRKEKKAGQDCKSTLFGRGTALQPCVD